MTDHTHRELVSPQQRMDAVPLDCARHSDDFGWQGIRIADYAVLPESDFTSPAMDHHLLVFHYTVIDDECRHYCARRQTATRLQPGQFSFIPADADNHWAFGKGTPSALHIHVDAGHFDAATTSSGLDLRDDFKVTSVQLRQISRRVQREMANNGAFGTLFADTMKQMICEEIVTLFGNGPQDVEAKDVNVCAARALIEAKFVRRIPLAGLAAVSNLSKSQLLRAFQRRFETSPHQYLLRKRVESAKRRLLSDSELPLAQIALDLGYANQSHFTRKFASATGVKPDRFRMPS
jgi:AraC family transcriptional regulator